MKLSYISNLSKLSLLSITVSMLFACGGNNESSATGWAINDEENGGFEAVTDYQEQETGPGLVFIEGGAFTMGRVQDDVMHDWNNTPKKIHVRSFYMDETEVTNVSYREYLYWTSRVFPSGDEYKFILSSALPDTLVWRNRLGANEVFVDNYLRHPAYNYYPVVGVNWIQATKFASWRTDRVNEKILIDRGLIRGDVNKMKDGDSDNALIKGQTHFTTEGYLKQPDVIFGDNKDVYNKGLPDISPKSDTKAEDGGFEGRHITMEDGIILPKYRLPTEAEWEFSALALIGNREFNTIKGRKKFPWNGKSAKSKNKRTKGDLLANFKAGRGDYKGIAGWSNDGADITNKVKSYPPNDYGLYDMAGNVSEWVADVYRPVIDGDANDFSYYRGNVFTRDSIGVDGIVTVGNGDVKYDTLSNGKLVPRALPGDIAKVNVNDKDTYMRPNYNKSNNINYNDGDKESSAFYEDDDNKSEVKKKMYNSPEYKYKTADNGKPKYDTDRRTSLINDRVRVYKGGSWADRVYWLDPAQRRYMQQDMSSNTIGFRCAMDRVGSAVVEGRSAY